MQQIRHQNPNPSYAGGQRVFVKDFFKGVEKIDGKKVETVRGAHVLQNVLIRYTKPVAQSKREDHTPYGYAYAQLKPGENVGITGYGAMAPVIAGLIDGKVYSLAGQINFREGRMFMNAEKLVEVKPVTADEQKAPAKRTRKPTPAAAPLDSEVPFTS